MASDILSKDASRFSDDHPAPSPSVRQVLEKILAPLASLKLTVALMGLGILLVLFGTLAQQYMNEFEAAKRFFRTWYTFVEIRSFFPRNFFPNLFLDKQPSIDAHWGFFFPGGITIAGLMALNLLAAHGLRFKIQSKGLRLWSGFAVIVIGAAVTYFVIVAGPDKDGFEASTKVHWADIHWYVKAALVGLIAACVAPLLKWRQRGTWECIALATAAVVLSVVTGYLLYRGDETVVQPEGLRILWQLLKGALAGVVLLIGCILVFRKRAGVTLLHAGVLLMMSNELIVMNWHEENLLHANVGETVNFVMRPRSPELAIVDASRPQADDVLAVPATLLEKGKTLSDPKLPFDVEVVDWMRNSTPIDLPPHMPNPATAGHGLLMTVISQPTANGAGGGDKEDMPSAFIRVKSKADGKVLGTYLVSYWFDPRLSAIDEELSVDEGQPLEVNGKTYQISLRPTRTYKPYALHLDDARESKYVGTNTAKSYESDAKLIDEKGNSRDVHIWMNNPIRYGGETFYQNSFGEDPITKVKFSIFQVVANVGWMVPYVACMIVAVGMLFHFSLTLVRFLKRMDKQDVTTEEKIFTNGPLGALLVASGLIRKSADKNAHETKSDDPILHAANIWIPLAAVLIPALMLVLTNRTPQQIDTAFHYWDCADLPVAYEGRVKPWDSLARNSLRFLSNKETFKDTARNKQPAIRWFLDSVVRPDDADKYDVFRIEHADVLNIFGLDQKEGLLYSLDDLRPRIGDFDDQVKKIERMKPEEQGEFERKILELDQRLKLYLTLRDAFRLPPEDKASALEQTAYVVEIARLTNPKTRPDLVIAPRAVPTSSATQPWEVATFSNAQVWLRRLADSLGEKTSADLARHLIDNIRRAELEPIVRSKMLADVEDILRQRMPNTSEQDAHKLAAKYLAEMPENLRSLADKQARQEIDDSLPQMQENLASGVQKILGDLSLVPAPDEPAAAVCDLLAAYRDGDVSKFNAAITAEKKELAAAPPVEYQPDKDEFERYFNYLALFTTARWLYLIAFVLVAIGWLGWLKPFNRAAFCLILFTFLIHTFAIVGRIYISGRPPVTNLYSSAVFIGWGGVLLGIILEILYGLSYGNVIAAVIGNVTLGIAEHLALEGETFIVMQAVLDTQFWLATHVSCVTLGYTTTYVSGLLGLVYLLTGMFTPSLTEKHGKLLARMIYGTTCFAIFFSFVGTVLGGLWADDSWGRFWGWDPKENGALIIVLWNALVLHARWDGLVKDRGLAVLALVGNIVTSWSWFGVNQLGLGRHSYGFTREVVDALTYLVLSHLALIALGSIKQSWWWSVRAQRAAALTGQEKRRGRRNA